MSALLAVLSVAGDSRLLLPAALFTGMSWWQRTPRMALAWWSALALVCAMVGASKLSWLLLETSIQGIDFYVISGHAAVSATVYPVAGFAIGLRTSPTWRWSAAAGGVLLAVVIAMSRVRMSLHSPSEICAGLLLGTAASMAMLWRYRRDIGTSCTTVAIAWSLAALLAAVLHAHIAPEDLLQRLAQRLRA